MTCKRVKMYRNICLAQSECLIINSTKQVKLSQRSLFYIDNELQEEANKEQNKKQVHVPTCHTLYLDPQTACATICVTVELISPRTVAPIKWARLHKVDASDLFLKPVKQTTRPSMVQE